MNFCELDVCAKGMTDLSTLITTDLQSTINQSYLQIHLYGNTSGGLKLVTR